VIDNNSTDGTYDYIKRIAQENHKLIFRKILERNAIKARNIGFSLASSDIVIHIDDDVIVDREWLKEILVPYKDESIGGVGGRLVQLGKTMMRNTIHIVGRISPWGQFFTNFDSRYRGEVQFLHGSNMSFRRHLVTKVKSLDPNYKMNWRDDTDLCLRIRKLGYRLFFQPTALVWHKGIGSTTRFSSGERLYKYFWNRHYFYYKNIFNKWNIPWSPIFTSNELAFCITLCARHSKTQHLRRCIAGIIDGTVAGLRQRVRS
jgi:GT2 family glycosyltransferase